MNGWVGNHNGQSFEGVYILLKDSTTDVVLNHTVSGTFGEFHFDVGSEIDIKQRYRFDINFFGYALDSVRLREDLYKLYISEASFSLKEIEIIAQKPIVYQGDTTSFRMSAFENIKEKKISDILNEIPGIQVDRKGNIQVYGQAVTTVTIDHDDVTQGRYQHTIPSLSAELFSEIQVIENFSENPLLGLFYKSGHIAINLISNDSIRNKLKGNAEVASDLTKYDSRLNLIHLSKSKKWLLTAEGNKVGKSKLYNFGTMPSLATLGIKQDDAFNLTPTIAENVDVDLLNKNNNVNTDIAYHWKLPKHLKFSLTGGYNSINNLIRSESILYSEGLKRFSFENNDQNKSTQYGATLRMDKYWESGSYITVVAGSNHGEVYTNQSNRSDDYKRFFSKTNLSGAIEYGKILNKKTAFFISGHYRKGPWQDHPVLSLIDSVRSVQYEQNYHVMKENIKVSMALFAKYGIWKPHLSFGLENGLYQIENMSTYKPAEHIINNELAISFNHSFNLTARSLLSHSIILPLQSISRSKVGEVSQDTVIGNFGMQLHYKSKMGRRLELKSGISTFSRISGNSYFANHFILPVHITQLSDLQSYLHRSTSKAITFELNNKVNMRLFFYSFHMSYSNEKSNRMESIYLPESRLRSVSWTNLKNNKNQFQIQLKSDIYSKALKHGFKLALTYQKSDYRYLYIEQPNLVHNQAVTLEASIKSGFSAHFRYGLTIQQSYNHVNVHNQKSQFKITNVSGFVKYQSGLVSMRLENYYNVFHEFSDARFNTDIHVEYKMKGAWESLTLSGYNIWNAKSIAVWSTQNSYQLSTSFIQQGRFFLLGTKFNF